MSKGKLLVSFPFGPCELPQTYDPVTPGKPANGWEWGLPEAKPPLNSAEKRRALPVACTRRVYAQNCGRCGTQISQRTEAWVCDFRACSWVVCLTCHKGGPGKVLLCPQHQSTAVQLSKPDGSTILVVASMRPPPAPPVPKGAKSWLGQLFQAVAVVLTAIPDTSASGVDKAYRYFTEWLDCLGITLDDVSPFVVCAYMLARTFPPVGVPLPEFMAKPVLPTTVAQDISCLRRFARLQRMPSLLRSLSEEDVIRMGHQLGAHIKPSHTKKAPLLIQHIRAVLARRSKPRRDGSKWSEATWWRNITVLLTGLLLALRRRELVALRWEDVVWGRGELLASIRRDKTNQCIVDAQCPRVVAVGHALLDEVWPRFLETVPVKARTGALFKTPGGGDLSVDSVRTILRDMLPELDGVLSPHSLRVGAATEMAAAGVPLATIMQVGRWKLAALHYVLPVADATVAATRAMGNGSVMLDRVLLQQAWGTDVEPPRVRVVCATAA